MPAKLTIQHAHDLAASKDGLCLSTEWINNKFKYLWQCSVGHKWAANYGSVRQGHWCPRCAGQFPKTKEDYDRQAEKHGGRCLSMGGRALDNASEWECSEKHQWRASYGTIQQGSWCPRCYGNVPKTKEDYDRQAEKHGGRCLSMGKNAPDNSSEWECSEKHRFNTSYGKVHQGQWCPVCKESKGEKPCREIFQELTGIHFYKDRPVFLRVSTGRILELDGHNQELHLAFEYQGKQHYKPVCFGGISQERAETNFVKQQQRDQRKRDLCKANGVTLIEIPYTVKRKDLESYIREQLIKAGFGYLLISNATGINAEAPLTSSSKATLETGPELST